MCFDVSFHIGDKNNKEQIKGMKNEKDAEDAVGNAILKVYEDKEQIDVFSKCIPWMLTVTKEKLCKGAQLQEIRQRNMEW